METDMVKVKKTFSGNTFSVNTGNKCFLCFSTNSNIININCDTIPNPDSADSNKFPIKTEKVDEEPTIISKLHSQVSLWAIFRQLKLNPNQFLKDLQIFEGKEDDQIINQFRNLVVPLCDPCRDIADQLTKLCKELEVIQMKVDNKLQDFQAILAKDNADDDDAEIEQNNYSVVKSLRTRLKERCSSKLKQRLPQLKIAALKPSKETESSANFYSEEPVVIKTECLEPSISVTLQETPISIPPIQINPPVGMPNKRECNQCHNWFYKTSLNRHRAKYCKGKPQPVPIPVGLPNQVQCDRCQKWLGKRSLPLHRQRHCRPFKPTPPKPIQSSKLWKPVYHDGKAQCHICHMTFTNSSSLLRHIRLMHPESGLVTSENEIKCKHCDRIMGKGHLSRHLKMHCPGPAEMITSDPLGDTELEKEKLKLEGKLPPTFDVPNVVKPAILFPKVKVRCNQCGAMVSKKNFLQHRKFYCPFGPKLPNPNFKPTKCNVCGKWYKSLPSMCGHRRKEHPEYTSAKMYKMQCNQISSVKSETTEETIIPV